MCIRDRCNIDGNFGVITKDGFGRAEVDFIQSAKLSLFDAKSIDSQCAITARNIFSYNATRVININDGVDQALTQLVEHIMALPPNHSRYADARAQLQRVYDISRNGNECVGVDPTDQGDTVSCGFDNNVQFSLRNAWFAACSSPDAISLGL